MREAELNCLMVEHALGKYPGLAKTLRKLDVHTHIKQTNSKRSALKIALKRLQGASLVFVPEELFESDLSQNSHQQPHSQPYSLQNQQKLPPQSLQVFADLIWQYAADSIVVVLGEDIQNKPFSYNMNDVQMSYMNVVNDNEESLLQLQFLVQTALLKYDFRRCKRLLGISEKRCQWLLESSVVPIANISRDLHLYANASYLKLMGVDSLQALRSLSVKDFIVEDEKNTFDSFIRGQLKHPNDSQSLLLQMQKKDGSQFRSSIRVIPSVFKGKRCLQLWVNPLQEPSEPLSEIAKLWHQNNTTPDTKMKNDHIKTSSKEREEVNNVWNKTTDINPAVLLKKIIRKKEAHIVTQELMDLNVNSDKEKNSPHYMVALKVPYAQRQAVDASLTQISQAEIETLRSLFWDKVKITRVLQILNTRKVRDIHLIIRLSEATIKNQKQIIWLQQNLKKIGHKAAAIMFMLPSRLDETGQRACVDFMLKMKPYGCQFALDDFFVNTQSLMLLKHGKPKALRLYLPWIQGIEGNEKREIALGRLIRQLESRNIKIIIPCGFSQDMKKQFMLSGASFCQERIR